MQAQETQENQHHEDLASAEEFEEELLSQDDESQEPLPKEKIIHVEKAVQQQQEQGRHCGKLSKGNRQQGMAGMGATWHGGMRMKDDISPLGVRYPVHGAYSVGRQPSAAPQQVFVGAVAWSYAGTDAESKQVKEFVPTTAGSGSTRPSWSRQKERALKQALKPMSRGLQCQAPLQGIAENSKESPQLHDPKGQRGKDALPTIQQKEVTPQESKSQQIAKAKAKNARILGHAYTTQLLH
jgi:hypothetical protein